MNNLPIEIFVDILAEDHTTALISDSKMVLYAVRQIKKFRDSDPVYSQFGSTDKSIAIFGNYVVLFQQFSATEIIVILHDPQLTTIPMENLSEGNLAALETIMDYIEANYDRLKSQVGLVKDI